MCMDCIYMKDVASTCQQLKALSTVLESLRSNITLQWIIRAFIDLGIKYTINNVFVCIFNEWTYSFSSLNWLRTDTLVLRSVTLL